MKCYAPWHAMTVRFNGDIVPDCVYTGKHGNILRESLPDVFANSGLQKTRNNIKQGILPKECSQCIKKEKAAGHSRRLFFRDILDPMLKEYDYSQDPNDIYFLEFNMSNVCNLKCRMCSGINSTGWVKEEHKLAHDKRYMRPIDHEEFGYRSVPWQIVDRLFAYPEYFQNLQYVNIKGGEPYLEPANKHIMRYLIDLGLAPNITLDISTNGTIIDEEFDELAMHFGKTKWHVSIEGTGELYEYIRGGENFTWEQFLNNLPKFEKFDHLIFAGTVMTYNVCHLNDIEKWFNENKKSNWELYLSNMVTMPPYLNPTILPDSILQDTNFNHDPELENQLKTFIDFTNELDRIRGTDIRDVCPELRTLFS